MHSTLHLELRRLIEAKSKRDNITFTACQLARALSMPRSMITKLTHPDESKRVTNPRIDTLMKIVEFFKADGFSITLEDLLGIGREEISIRDQLIPENQALTVPIYSLDKPDKCLGKAAIKSFACYNKVLAFRASTPIKPFFKTGSLFIVDQEAELENEVLIAVKLTADNQVSIKKYKKKGRKILLESLDPMDKNILLLPTTQIVIIGVVVQINAQA